jgi:hypothetical protein
MVKVRSTAETSVSADGCPSGPIRRTAMGETGSLKVSLISAGGCATTARSTGSLPTSEA